MPDSSPRGFATTRWSLVLAASSVEGPRTREALEELCRAYWPPLHAWLRGRGVPHAEAEDLVQGFLARVLERGDLADLAPEKGRFRSWLLASLRNHRVNELARSNALKRGGGRQEEGWSDSEGDEPSDPGETPEEAFERAWAETVLKRAADALEERYRELDQAALFEALKGHLSGHGRPFAEIAKELGTTEGALKVAAHRLRARFREALRSEVLSTLRDPADLEDELAHLQRALIALNPRR